MKEGFARFFLCFLTLAVVTLSQAASIHTPRINMSLPPDSGQNGQKNIGSVISPETRFSIPPIDNNPGIPGDPIKPDTTGINTPIDSESYVLNEGYSVGTPKGIVAVSKLGAATYNLPIEVPNGGALTPRIGLSYNSQLGGYGLAGYGFNITGISVITRGGHDMFHDQKQAGVTYTESDNLFIDGKRLILQSGSFCQEGAIYTVEGEPFTKVIVHGSCNNSTATTWFEVITPTGMTYQYGNSQNSKLSYKNKNGLSRIASWYINKQTDKHGNYIIYDYVINHLCVLPLKITYGLNAVKSRGIVNEISFTYKSLGANARTFVIEDQPGKIDHYLSSVTTTSKSQTYRTYTLSYFTNSDNSFGKWTRLVKVEEANGNGEKLPPIVFHWQFLPTADVRSSQLDVSTSSSNGLVQETSTQFLTADLNGDGVSDIIRVSSVKVTTAIWNGGSNWELRTYVYVSRSRLSASGKVTYDTPLLYTLPAGISLDVIKSMFGGTSVMDFDGDGYNDLVFPFQNTVTNQWNQVVFYVVLGSDVVSGRNDVPRVFVVNLRSTDRAPLFATYDVDGNGKDEVVCVEQRKLDDYYPCTIVQLTDGTSLNRTELKLTLPQGVSQDIEKIFVGDYNNDGLTDLILLYNGGYKIYFNNGGNTIASRFSESNTKSGVNFGNYWRVQQGDFDGDGLADFIYNNAGEALLWVAHNNGNGTFTPTSPIDIGVSEHASEKDDKRFSLLAYDIDHDGRTDVMVCKAGYVHRGFPRFRNDYTNTQVRWLYSTGTSF